MSAYTGEIAGLLTSFCWSLTSIFFTLSGRLVGSPVVNRTRLVFALLMVSGLHLVTEGALLPLGAPLWRWGWFSLSGLIGFVIGDALLFQAFVMIGPRLSMLLMALNPVIGAALAWVLLSETLSGLEMLGIALAIAGVAWVIVDRNNGAAPGPSDPPDSAPEAAPPEESPPPAAARYTPRFYVGGVLFGLGGALGQATGLIASKQGLADDFPALSGNLMRLIFATAAIWIVTALQGNTRRTWTALHDQPKAIRFILIGSIAGPFVGVTLSLIAVQNAEVGIASTLMSLTPVILLPVGFFFFHERITWRAVVGTLLAIAGTAILFLAE